jgi:hypothetical protein
MEELKQLKELKTAQASAKKSDRPTPRSRAETDLLICPKQMFYESRFTAAEVLSLAGHGVDSVRLHQLYVFEIGAILIRLFQDGGQSAVASDPGTRPGPWVSLMRINRVDGLCSGAPSQWPPALRLSTTALSVFADTEPGNAART